MILRTISNHIADVFLRRNIISVETKRICAYGLELLFSTIISLTICAIVSIFLHDFGGYIIFLAVFIPFRLLAGGYHANSHTSCCVCFLALYICAFLNAEIVLNSNIRPFILIVSICTFVLILLYAPVEHPNKKISPEKKIANRKRSIVLCLIWVIVAFAISVHDDIANEYIVRFFSGELIAVISFTAGVIKYRRRRFQ